MFKRNTIKTLSALNACRACGCVVVRVRYAGRNHVTDIRCEQCGTRNLCAFG